MRKLVLLLVGLLPVLNIYGFGTSSLTDSIKSEILSVANDTFSAVQYSRVTFFYRSKNLRHSDLLTDSVFHTTYFKDLPFGASNANAIEYRDTGSKSYQDVFFVLKEIVILLRDTLLIEESISSAQELREKYRKAKDEKVIAQQELIIQLKENTIYQSRLWILLLLALFVIGLILFFFSYRTNKMKAEQNRIVEKSNQLLEEKNQQIATLNEELSHRIKNNLTFVWSLLRMQSRRLDSPEAKAAVKEAQSRVEAMAMVHRRLYENENNRTIEMVDYLHQLCAYLVESYASINHSIIINSSIERLTLEADVAVQIGLIINELMTNSFKHAFEKQAHPSIKIELRKNEKEEVYLNYQDNGIGVPPSFDVRECTSLGLRLIHDLTTQLNGIVRISNQSGAFFRFIFKDLKISS